MKSRLSGIKCYICIILAVFLLASQPVFAATAPNDERNLEYLQSVIDMVREEYGGEATDKQLIVGALSGMLSSLDPYTTYYEPKEKETFVNSLMGIFGGIGVTMELSGDYAVVISVNSGSPAEKSGILQGDKLVEADGKSLVKKNLQDVAALIKGTPGTTVKIGVLRGSSKKAIYYTVTREIIKVNPVTYEIRNGIGYIKLEQFNDYAEEFVSKALTEMDQKGIDKIALDLRNNPGGEVGQAVLIAKRFVPSGLITKLDYKSEQYPDIEYYSNLVSTKYKLTVLINESSASASEILAGAIQDTGAGRLVGTRSFGKGKFQGVMPILTPQAFAKYSRQTGDNIVNAFDLEYLYAITPEKSEILGYTKMTLGYYLTPHGRKINGIGLTPNVRVANPKPVAGISVNGIQKMKETTAYALKEHGADVYQAKLILKVLGYKIGGLDTALDDQTANALKQYQKSKKMVSNGLLDVATQKVMNAERLALISKYDMQYSAAERILNNPDYYRK